MIVDRPSRPVPSLAAIEQESQSECSARRSFDSASIASQNQQKFSRHSDMQLNDCMCMTKGIARLDGWGSNSSIFCPVVLSKANVSAREQRGSGYIVRSFRIGSSRSCRQPLQIMYSCICIMAKLEWKS